MDKAGPQRCPAGMDAHEPLDVFAGLAPSSVVAGFSYSPHCGSFVVSQFYEGSILSTMSPEKELHRKL